MLATRDHPARRRARRTACLLGTLVWATACSAAQIEPLGSAIQPPELTPTHVTAADGYRLPLHRWLPEQGEAHAVVLGLHGFNDYGRGLEALATTLTEWGIGVYAYDQRGFGATEAAGLWHTRAALVSDAITVASLLRARYPDTPFYLLGKSMGAAVALVALAGDAPPPVDGVVLIAPATAGPQAMPWYQRFALWLGERVAPGMELSAELARSLGVEPTDQPSVIEALREDPLVQEEARIDALEGLAELMGVALEAVEQLRVPGLILYGERDELVPPEAICLMLERLPPELPEEKPTEKGNAARPGPTDAPEQPRPAPWTVAIYPEGYHMLTRFSGRAQTHRDIAHWLTTPGSALPSGRGMTPQQAREVLCD